MRYNRHIHKSYSLGLLRDDGDFHILATLNNNDDLIPEDLFEELRIYLVAKLTRELDESVYSYPRQDTPDYVNLQIGD
jgi:hypothetical protein